jgi:hypothetical protein
MVRCELAELDTPSPHSYFESALLVVSHLGRKVSRPSALPSPMASANGTTFNRSRNLRKKRRTERLCEDVGEGLRRREVAHLELAALVEVPHLVVLQVHALRLGVALDLCLHGDRGLVVW